MAKIPISKLRDLSEGIIQGVDPSITPPNSCYLAVNLMFDEVLGRAVLRKGTTQLGSQISSGNACDGLFMYIKSNGTLIPLACFAGTIYKYTMSSWSSSGKTGLTSGKKCHFVHFLDVVTFVNGTDSPATFNGTDWSNTATHDTANFPNGKYVIEWKDRIYVAGVSGNPDRLYYSSTPIAGAISFTSGNGYIDIEPEDKGGSISGLAAVPGYLLIFKERSLKRWDGSSTYPESLITIGAPSQEAIVQTKQSVFYFNKRGIYETVGGYPRKISRRVQDIIDAIPSTYYSSVSGFGDGERIYFSIGDITLDGLTWNNCVLVRNLDSQTWTLLSFPNEFKMWSNYVDNNGDEKILAGDDDGNVWQVLEGTQDGSSDINWLLQYHPQEFGSRGRIKEISKIISYTKKVRNGVVSCRKNEEGNFNPIGNITKAVQEIEKSLKANYFEFRLQGSGRTGAEVIGLDFPETSANLNYSE